MALNLFVTRIIVTKDVDVSYKDEAQITYDRFYNNEMIANFIYTYWSDKKMIKTFPNTKIETENGEIVFIRDLLPEIEPYYMKWREKSNE